MTDAHERLGELRGRLALVRLADRGRLARELERLAARPGHGARGAGDGRGAEAAIGRLAASIEASAAEVSRLLALPLRTGCDPGLPIAAHRAEIHAALARHPVIVVCGATGSGKTTQLPKLCLEAGRGALGMIGHTQPRRIAARSLAARIASELGAAVGGAVGYQVRFADRTGPDTRLKLMTDGILLAELEGDRDLRRYDTLIIDEAHERTLNVDLLLGVVKRLVTRRPELRVIVTSATIDPGKFARFFDGAPVIEVSGRSYPVELRYRPLSPGDEDAAELSLPEGIVAAVRELHGEPGQGAGGSAGAGTGDVLVFLPGEKHIREAADALAEARLPATDVVPLFARLSAREQERIFEPHQRRRVVLATNVAETSLTVPGIRYVVDSGLARIGRYNPRVKVQRLPVERISQASAEQRRGRCGREAPGICIRLYAEEDFDSREPFTAPEVLRTNLASVILQMAARGLGEAESFPFLDPPDTRLVNDGVRLLQELRAMDEERHITSLGRRIASLPVDPRLARMLLAASHHGCLAEMLVIAAFLEAQDPRERPAGAQRQADERHAAFADGRSDFLSVLNLWHAWQAQSVALGRNALRRWCRDAFLSFTRMREWQDLHAQLTEAVAESQPPQAAARSAPAGGPPAGPAAVPDAVPDAVPAASYAGLHRAILTGFLGSIGRLIEKREYEGARAVRFVIAPGTPLANRPPRWVVAGSLVETTRLYARMVALVQPPWIEAAAEHLVRRSYSEAHWLPARGYVAAEESVSLYGLTLAQGRLVNYAPLAPAIAREVFAREALVEARGGIDAPFLAANRRLRAEVEGLEARIRRRDILVDDQALVEFYLARLPERLDTLSAFERWRLGIERSEPRRLYMTRADLMRREAPEASDADYPDVLAAGENRLPLQYRFDPTAADDGVTVTVPEAALESLHEEQLAWLVPGRRLEKITALLRALPKAIRKQFVPVPEHARLALEDALREERVALPPFHDWLARWIARHAGGAFTAAELAALPLPDHLRMNLRVIDSAERILGEGRDLTQLRARLRGNRVRAPALAVATTALHREWDFGPLEASVAIERARLRLVLYPAIEDRGSGVALVEMRSPGAARAATRAGLARLAALAHPQLARHLHKRFAEDRELVLRAHGVPLTRPLADSLTDRCLREQLFPEGQPLPASRAAFLARLDERRAGLDEAAGELARLATKIFAAARELRGALDALTAPAFAQAATDLRRELASLLRRDFLEATPAEWLAHYPRYLAAAGRRVERLRGNLGRDATLAARGRPFREALLALDAQSPARGGRPQLELLRWMSAEFAVSLHAQELGTALRVSEKRLAEQLALARAEARS